MDSTLVAVRHCSSTPWFHGILQPTSAPRWASRAQQAITSEYFDVIGAALWLTGVGVLWIVAAVALFRTVQGEAGRDISPRCRR